MFLFSCFYWCSAIGFRNGEMEAVFWSVVVPQQLHRHIGLVRCGVPEHQNQGKTWARSPRGGLGGRLRLWGRWNVLRLPSSFLSWHSGDLFVCWGGFLCAVRPFSKPVLISEPLESCPCVGTGEWKPSSGSSEPLHCTAAGQLQPGLLVVCSASLSCLFFRWQHFF